MIKKISILLIGAFFIMMIMVMFSGCITQKKCNAKFPPVTEIKTEHTKETIIRDSLLPGATIYHTIYKDSIQFYPEYKWKVIRDTSGLAELRIMKDAHGNITATCEATEQLISRMEVIESKVDSKTEVTHQTDWYIPGWIWMILGIMLSAIIYLRFFR